MARHPIVRQLGYRQACLKMTSLCIAVDLVDDKGRPTRIEVRHGTDGRTTFEREGLFVATAPMPDTEDDIMSCFNVGFSTLESTLVADDDVTLVKDVAKCVRPHVAKAQMASA